MADVPPGWYTNPDDSSQLRWWNGTAWSATTAPLSTPQSGPSRGPLIAVVSIVGLFALISLVTSGIGGLLAALGFTVAVIAVVALVRGSLPKFLLRSRRAAGIALAASFVMMLVGGAVSPVQTTATANLAQQTSDAGASDSSTAPTLEEPEPRESSRREQTTSVIPFASTTIDDPDSDIGTSTVTVEGVDGVMTTIWRITFTDGKETGREKISEEVTLAPIDQVTSVGSRVAPAPQPVESACDSNYSGACVPIASDVDCAGGSGNGPAYVSGPVFVIGSDVYDLDRDGDGIACD